MDKVEPTIKLKKDNTPYKRQPKKREAKIPNVITSEKVQLIDKLDDKTYVKTFTTDSIIVSFNAF